MGEVSGENSIRRERGKQNSRFYTALRLIVELLVVQLSVAFAVRSQFAHAATALVSRVIGSGLMLLNICLMGGRRNEETTPFGKKPPMRLEQKMILFSLTVLPIMAMCGALGFHLKPMYELGSRLTALHIADKAIEYIYRAFTLALGLCFIYALGEFFDSTGARNKLKFLPIGGIILALTDGITAAFLLPSSFSVVYALLWVYADIIYKVSGRRYGAALAVCVVVMIL